ncbi:MAG: ferric reductase-like transmembrane domain-containing protein [Sandaracinaceae bacterium]|nr:ferric reductase-like transmembrane domain-containing protein [Sandaracinaceae bacterium]
MSAKFVTVQWNRKKLVYDAVLLAAVGAYIGLFTVLGHATSTGARSISAQTLDMRAWGSCAYLMLVVILCIGPLARLDRRFSPLLYNRRHFGVLMFAVAATHASKVLGYYHAYGKIPQLESLFTWDAVITRASLPFQLFGAAALLVFCAMALTSHDFWQKLLGPTGWKTLHMGVYLAFALVVLHVAFGALQWETHPAFLVVFGGSVALVGGLHVAAARRSAAPERTAPKLVDGWIDAGPPERIPDTRALPVVNPRGERIALVRWEGKVAALHGVCAHQGGPLYEGKVIDGCLTCPWHGWQYKPGDGCSPPPFTEKLPTYRVKLSDEGHVLVDPTPLPDGTPTEPIVLAEASDG